MSVHSYGILLFQRTESGLRVLLAHPGGPFWAGKDDGAWSIPKGLPQQGETALETARREFREETGFAHNTINFLLIYSAPPTHEAEIRLYGGGGNLQRTRLWYPPRF